MAATDLVVTLVQAAHALLASTLDIEVVTFRFIDGRFFDAIHATVRLDGRPLPLRIVEAQHGAEPRLRVILISDNASDGWGVGIVDGLAVGLRRALVQADANTHRAVGPPW